MNKTQNRLVVINVTELAKTAPHSIFKKTVFRICKGTALYSSKKYPKGSPKDSKTAFPQLETSKHIFETFLRKIFIFGKKSHSAEKPKRRPSNFATLSRAKTFGKVKGYHLTNRNLLRICQQFE